MKKNYILILGIFFSLSAYSQTYNTDFEDLSLAVDTFWNGVDQTGQFTSNTVVFRNIYDTAWGGFWSAGASYSTMRNDSIAGSGNQYSCIAGEGYNSSQTYAVFTPNNDTALVVPTSAVFISGFWINNSTYAYLSMKNGDSFAKKFGDTLNAAGINDGTNGNDWFKLTIYGDYSDSVEFYLADFSGPDSSDYILKDWTYVDLSSLNRNTRSLKFKMSSSDVGTWGMNTPKYFCMDNFEYQGVLSINELSENSISVFPNPTKNKLNVQFDEIINNASYKLIDITGREVISSSVNGVNSLNLDLSNQNNGVYFLTITIDNKVITKKIIKQ